MFEESRIVFLYTETSFHPGSGDSIVGVDLPIQRERHTNYPKNQGGGVKGALRDLAKQKKLAELDEIFGPKDAGHQGALSLTEARILLFPVKSLKGVFAWITCPFVIERFKRDLKRMNSDYSCLDNIRIFSVTDEKALVTEPCLTKTTTNKMVLEDLSFDAEHSKQLELNQLAKWFGDNALRDDASYEYWRTKLNNSLVMVSDDVFRDFVVYYTEVSTRHKRSETGTVQDGALWNEETLPSETLMYSSILASRSNKKESSLTALQVIEKIENIINESRFMQMGASETVGQGFVGIRCFNPVNTVDDGTNQVTVDGHKSGSTDLKTEDNENVELS